MFILLLNCCGPVFTNDTCIPVQPKAFVGEWRIIFALYTGCAMYKVMNCNVSTLSYITILFILLTNRISVLLSKYFTQTVSTDCELLICRRSDFRECEMNEDILILQQWTCAYRPVRPQQALACVSCHFVKLFLMQNCWWKYNCYYLDWLINQACMQRTTDWVDFVVPEKWAAYC